MTRDGTNDQFDWVIIVQCCFDRCMKESVQTSKLSLRMSLSTRTLRLRRTWWNVSSPSNRRSKHDCFEFYLGPYGAFET